MQLVAPLANATVIGTAVSPAKAVIVTCTVASRITATALARAKATSEVSTVLTGATFLLTEGGTRVAVARGLGDVAVADTFARGVAGAPFAPVADVAIIGSRARLVVASSFFKRKRAFTPLATVGGIHFDLLGAAGCTSSASSRASAPLSPFKDAVNGTLSLCTRFGLHIQRAASLTAIGGVSFDHLKALSLSRATGDGTGLPLTPRGLTVLRAGSIETGLRLDGKRRRAGLTIVVRAADYARVTSFGTIAAGGRAAAPSGPFVQAVDGSRSDIDREAHSSSVGARNTVGARIGEGNNDIGCSRLPGVDEVAKNATVGGRMINDDRRGDQLSVATVGSNAN